MAKKHTALKTIARILVVIYLAGPVIAALLRYPDRRGPRIYPEIYHGAVFHLVYVMCYGQKPRYSRMYERAWFYGMERPVDEELARKMAVRKWFPEMKNPPPIVPVLPDGFVAGYATNPLIWKGQPTLLWAPPADIERLHRETTVRQIFVITEQTEELVQPGLLAGEEAIKRSKEAGHTNLEYGMAVLDGWTMEWVSSLSPSEYGWGCTASFFDPHNKGRFVNISLLAAGEDGQPVWRAFIDSCRKHARDLTPAEREEIRQAHDPANFPVVDPFAEDPFAEPAEK